MAERMGGRKPFSDKNVSDVPDQSGVYNFINQAGQIVYTGSAGLREHLLAGDIPGTTHFQIRPTSSTAEARKVEQQLIKRNQPRHNTRGK